MVCAKPVITPAEPAGSKQHLKYPIFRTHAMSRTVLGCPRTSHQCGLFADSFYQNQGPHSILGSGRSTIPCCPSGLCPPPTAVTHTGTHVRLARSPPGHSSPPQPQELGTGKPKGCFSPLMLMIEVFHFTPSSGS